ncbi:hypothetical protein LY78DRAFT_653913 [Colletotrichum sublineola]|nr:hypothetical protein LY78DRAFT_653913 [Colletotrichum sublineola]
MGALSFSGLLSIARLPWSKPLLNVGANINKRGSTVCNTLVMSVMLVIDFSSRQPSATVREELEGIKTYSEDYGSFCTSTY